MRRATVLAFAVGLLIGLAVAGGVATLWLRAEQARDRAKQDLEKKELELRDALEQRERVGKLEADLAAANQELDRNNAELKAAQERLENELAESLMRAKNAHIPLDPDQEALLKKLAEKHGGK